MLNEGTFGFNSADANALLDLIATHDVEHEEIKPLGSSPSGGGGVEVYQYQLGQDMALQSILGGSYFIANGVVRHVNSLTDDFSGSGVIVDTTGTAAHQIAGDRGLVAHKGSGIYYFVIEPDCNFDAFTPGTGGGGSVPISTTIANPSNVSP